MGLVRGAANEEEGERADGIYSKQIRNVMTERNKDWSFLGAEI